MLKSCKWCGRVHPAGFVCPMRPARGAQTSAAASVRSSSRWQRVRSEVRQRDGGLCRWCLAQGRVTLDDVQVHHITPLEQDPNQARAYDPEWLICLCSRGGSSCHARAERGEIPADTLHRLALQRPSVP